jgi:uncharacterized protein YdeI (YjbR/CyaY-like superfamily)
VLFHDTVCMMSALDDAASVELDDRAGWRRWLEANHRTATGVWLVTWRTGSGRRPLAYDAAVEEALCFGWVDGQAAIVDELRGKQYYAPRKRGSPWARSNKERVERLLQAGAMAPAGIAVVERAKADGSWSVLDSAERLEVPPELAEALAARPPARDHWDAFSPAVRRAHLGWIALAKRPETRTRRIGETAAAAQRNERATG